MFFGSWFLHAVFLLVFLRAPPALGESCSLSLFHDGLAAAVEGLLRVDEVDAQVVIRVAGKGKYRVK